MNSRISMIPKSLKSIVALLTFLCTVPIEAKVVSKEKALEFASRFFSGNSLSRNNSASLQCIWDSNELQIKTRNSSDAPTFYVITPSEGRGFVIVAGDDVSFPVWGYSFENKVSDVENLPENLRSWLEGMHQSIVQARTNQIPASSNVQQRWIQSRAGDPLVMLKTPSWGQGYPYNIQCPKDGILSKVGCTAVAIATIMRYYGWPETGKGITEAYTTSSKGIYVEARNLEHEYDWNKMKMEYISDSYNSDEADAVATLMADVAIGIKADFTSNSTSASAKIDVLYNHFDYHPGMYWVNRENFESNEWNQLMIDELMEDRPIFYRGNDSASNLGHAFVLDGCTTDNYFHINWGWSGYCDGYFYLDALNPSDSDYNYNQSAILNMIPNDGSGITVWLTAFQTGIATNATDFHPYSPFQVTACVRNGNGFMEFSGSFRLAVTDKDGNIKEWICEERTGMNLKPFYYYPSLNFSCTITGDIEIGDRIRMFYREQDKEEWNLITSVSSSTPWEILIADEFTISESTSVSFDKETGVLIVSFKDDVAATISRNGQPVATGVAYNPNSLEVETKKLTEGIYTIRLEKGLDVKVFNFEVKPL